MPLTLSTPTSYLVTPPSLSYPSQPAHPAQFVVGQGAGIHEGLSNDQEHCVHVIRCLHIEHKLGVFDDVDPEPQWQAANWGNKDQ